MGVEDNNDLLRSNVKLLRLSCLYPVDKNASYFIKLVDWLFKLVATSLLYCIWVACIYELCLGEKEQLTDYTLNIMNVGCYICSLLTLHFFHYQSDKLYKLVSDMRASFKYRSNTQFHPITMDRINKQTKNITIGFISLLNTAVVMMAIVPLLMKGRQLPVPGAYPYDWKISPYYETTYLLQVIGQVILGLVTSTADTFFIVAVLLTAEQFKLLACNFRNCLHDVLLGVGMSKSDIAKLLDNPQNYQLQPVHFRTTDNTTIVDKASHLVDLLHSIEVSKRANELLIAYIKDHQNLLSFCERMESFFWPIILIKVAISMFYHIFITFAMVSSTDWSLAFTLGQYELCAVSELFIFSLVGQTLINESENLSLEVFAAPWYLCNKQFKTSIHLILLRCSHPTTLSIGKLTDMSLPAFIVIMKTALSYFAVLRQVTTQ